MESLLKELTKPIRLMFHKKARRKKPKIRKCKACKCEITENGGGSNGEKRNGRWVYWHHKCYMDRFVRQIGSSPLALAKYYEIYGKHPKDILSS